MITHHEEYLDLNWSNHNDVVIIKCDNCGSERRCRKQQDPYDAEIHPEKPNPETWWCEPCYQNQCDDI